MLTMDHQIAEQVDEFFRFYSEKGLEGDALAEALQTQGEEAQFFGHTELGSGLCERAEQVRDGEVTRTFVTSRGDEVVTTLTDEEAIEAIREMAGYSSFAASLFEQHTKSSRPLSAKQWAWVHKLAVDQIARAAKKAAKTTTVYRFPSLVDLFATARNNGHKRPKITLDLPEGRIQLSVAGPRSSRPGTINITDGGPFGENVWYGRISAEGAFEPSRSCQPFVSEALTAMDEDRIDYVVKYGAKTGNCCFCTRHLSTKESVTAGYGPICAEKWGLPWGEVG